jgi:hypothetical protein
MKITPEMIEDRPGKLQQILTLQLEAINQEEWCRIYTGRSWFNDVGPEWTAHAALMCDAREIEFGDYPLLAPLGGCDHPYDIALPCALKNWVHAKFVEESDDYEPEV